MARAARPRATAEGGRAPQTAAGTRERKGVGYQDAEPQQVAVDRRNTASYGAAAAAGGGGKAQGPPGGRWAGAGGNGRPAGREGRREERREERREGGGRAGVRGAALAARRHFEARGAEGEESPAEVGAGPGVGGAWGRAGAGPIARPPAEARSLLKAPGSWPPFPAPGTPRHASPRRDGRARPG